LYLAATKPNNGLAEISRSLKKAKQTLTELEKGLAENFRNLKNVRRNTHAA
jgi:hypothetical protein